MKNKKDQKERWKTILNRALTNAFSPKKFWTWGVVFSLFSATIFFQFVEIGATLFFDGIRNLLLNPADQEKIIKEWSEGLATNPLPFLRIFFLVIGTFVIVKLVGFVLEGALILAFKNKSAKIPVGFLQSLFFGIKNFKKIFKIRFQLFSLLVLATFAISLPLNSLLVGSSKFLGEFLMFVGLALWLVIFFISTLIGQLAVFFAVLKEQDAKEALNQAYALVFLGLPKSKKEIALLWLGEKSSLLTLWLLEIFFVVEITPRIFFYLGYSAAQMLLPALLLSLLFSIPCQNIRIIFSKNLWFLFFKRKNAVKIKKTKAIAEVSKTKVVVEN
jgi:hypothetical protein